MATAATTTAAAATATMATTTAAAATMATTTAAATTGDARLHVTTAAPTATTAAPTTSVILNAGDRVSDQRLRVGATIWTKGTVVTNDCSLHRWFGANAKKTWIPGIVKRGIIKRSATNKSIKYIQACYYLGGSNFAHKEICLSSCKLRPPKDTDFTFPTDLSIFERDGGVVIPVVPICNMPPSMLVSPVTTTTSPVAAGDATSTDSSITMDPTAVAPVPTTDAAIDASYAAINAAIDADANVTIATTIIAHDTTWKYDADAVNIDCNGPLPSYDWSFRDGMKDIQSPMSDVHSIK